MTSTVMMNSIWIALVSVLNVHGAVPSLYGFRRYMKSPSTRSITEWDQVLPGNDTEHYMPISSYMPGDILFWNIGGVHAPVPPATIPTGWFVTDTKVNSTSVEYSLRSCDFNGCKQQWMLEFVVYQDWDSFGMRGNVLPATSSTESHQFILLAPTGPPPVNPPAFLPMSVFIIDLNTGSHKEVISFMGDPIGEGGPATMDTKNGVFWTVVGSPAPYGQSIQQIMAISVRGPNVGKLLLNVTNSAPPGMVLMEYDHATGKLWGIGIYGSGDKGNQQMSLHAMRTTTDRNKNKEEITDISTYSFCIVTIDPNTGVVKSVGNINMTSADWSRPIPGFSAFDHNSRQFYFYVIPKSISKYATLVAVNVETLQITLFDDFCDVNHNCPRILNYYDN